MSVWTVTSPEEPEIPCPDCGLTIHAEREEGIVVEVGYIFPVEITYRLTPSASVHVREHYKGRTP